MDKDALNRLVRLLQAQLQRALAQRLDCPFAVKVASELDVGERVVALGDAPFENAIAVFMGDGSVPAVARQAAAPSESLKNLKWVINVTQKAPSPICQQACASAAIADYWELSLASCELWTYSGPAPSGYQACRLLQVGDSAAPTTVPTLRLRLQEPVPLFFVTRTLNGQRTHLAEALPLQLCPANG